MQENYFDFNEYSLKVKKTAASSINDYKVIRVLDSGAYGVVKLAKHKLINKPVALKIIDADKLEKVGKTRHVFREKDLLYQLNH